MNGLLTPGDLQDLYLNLRDEIEELAGRAGLRHVLDIRRGRPPRRDDDYFAHMTWTVFKAGINGTTRFMRAMPVRSCRSSRYSGSCAGA